METKAKRIKFNIVDLIILLLIVGAAVFFLWRYILPSINGNDPGKGDLEEPSQYYHYTLTLDGNDVPDDNIVGKLEVGSTIVDRANGTTLGVVTEVITEPSRTYVSTDDGKIVIAPRPLHSRITIRVEGVGLFPEEGGLIVEDAAVYINKAYDILVDGKAFFHLRLHDMTQGGEAEPPIVEDDEEEK